VWACCLLAGAERKPQALFVGYPKRGWNRSDIEKMMAKIAMQQLVLGSARHRRKTKRDAQMAREKDREREGLEQQKGK
jgi:hypothetical protein